MIVDLLKRLQMPLTKKGGQGMVEYAFIITLVAIGLVFALRTLGVRLFEFFSSVTF